MRDIEEFDLQKAVGGNNKARLQASLRIIQNLIQNIRRKGYLCPQGAKMLGMRVHKKTSASPSAHKEWRIHCAVLWSKLHRYVCKLGNRLLH